MCMQNGKMTFFLQVLLQNTFFCVIACLVGSCVTPTTDEKVKVTLDDWCECMREHAALGEQAHQICTEKYKQEISFVMIQKSLDVDKDTTLSLPSKENMRDSIIMKKRMKQFENMGQMLRQLSKKCLEDL